MLDNFWEMRDKFQEMLDILSNMLDICYFGPNTFELHDISRKMLDNFLEM